MYRGGGLGQECIEGWPGSGMYRGGGLGQECIEVVA